MASIGPVVSEMFENVDYTHMHTYERTTDACLYFKLANEPKGSGELKISLKSDFIQFFHDFIHVYISGAGADSPQGTKFSFFHDLIHVYSPGADSPLGTKL